MYRVWTPICASHAFTAVAMNSGPLYVRWWTVDDEQLGKDRQNVRASDPAGNEQCKTLPACFIDDRKDPELAAIVGAAFNEVVSPDMPRILRPQPDARTVVQPQPTALRLLLRHL
jgi:hypothetical protein